MKDYFFHANALEPGLNFDDIEPDHAVVFEVKTGPTPFRAGAARLVRDDHEAVDDLSDEDMEEDQDDVDEIVPAVDDVEDVGGGRW